MKLLIIALLALGSLQASECKDSLADAASVFRTNDGSYFSIKSKGDFALDIIKFAKCYTFDEERDKETARATITWSIQNAERNKFGRGRNQ